MSILIVGGAGYIGSHVVKQLNEAGFATVVYDSLKKGHREAVVSIDFIQGDILDTHVLSQVFRKHQIEAVMHFAADSMVGESVGNPLAYFENNVAGTINLLKVMINFEIKRFVFSSTAAVYGEPEQIPIMEDNPTKPTNPYGESKLMIEQILSRCDEAYDLRYISLRYFNAAGADSSGILGEDHQPETHLIPLILQAASGQRENINIFGIDYPTTDGSCIRDYIHVTDLANAHILALQALIEGKTSNVYNLGNGKGYSVKQVIEATKKVIGHEIPTIETGRRLGDPSVLIASSAKAFHELNWKPELSDLETIISTAWQWHKNHPKGYAK
ncbi:UDP-glucose 4-epimerase GalE [Candidatus Desantisbacteria bacterium CG_4_9_14_3_um_filter_40_11]|uniref:UDP-glucose 4-epimerase n=2 Tax=unclassified Candidatus Desantisiibacteriota TaxID=3106372 RepID=A0A2M7JED9_9BACT|nr:MAG: UDP-glucose 4-epimerase GalE [Candidatus Desantisbacteria bacterium CG_4_8_14_3_um_filter_40_12]PJB28887.1 MAG: UDP-glucose 4-epimerase GalE [Candidatus Desantisbacteria bacterium CG_4_9_14_3_um_filter_40_11]